MDELFSPPAYDWQRLSPKFLALRRLSTIVFWAVFATVPAVFIGLISGRWWISGLIWAAAAVIIVLRYRFLPRSTASWGYVERDADLYITHGVWFKSMTAVPYGRMQLVEVESGPLQRKFGLATVTLKTAAPGTDATIPGLDPDEAARLRDQLTSLGEAHASGL